MFLIIIFASYYIVMDYTNYKSKIYETVKFHEVDLMGVVNNAVYFSYFEDARMEYLQLLKDNYKLDGILEQDSFFIMAHNEIDYLLPAEYKDELTVYTKIDWIKNTLLAEKNISPEDLDFFVVVDTVEEVMKNLNQFYSKENFKPNF